MLRSSQKVPYYARLYGELRHAILSGDRAPGSRVPASRSLASALGVSRNVVLAAYDQLVAEGYLVGRRGSGMYVTSTLPDPHFGKTGRAAREPVGAEPPRLSAYGRRAGEAADPINVPASGGVPLTYDFRYGRTDVDPISLEAWRRLLARESAKPALDYGQPEGRLELRRALATYLRQNRAVECDPDRVMVVTGSQQALDLSIRVLLDPGDTVVLEDPHYQGARRAFAAAGARLATVPVDAHGFDPSRLARIRKPRLMYVTPSHQFPTGTVLPLARRLTLLDWARRHRCHLIEDDYDSEYRYEGKPIEAVQALDHEGLTVYTGTLSKVLFPALRIGYLVLPTSLVQPFVGAKWLADRHTPTLGQLTLARFLMDGHFERHLRRSRRRFGLRREALLDALHHELGERVEVADSGAGVHMVVWLPDLTAADMPELIARAAALDVGLYSIAPYYHRAPTCPGLLFGFASLTERDIQAGVRRFARALSAHAVQSSGPR